MWNGSLFTEFTAEDAKRVPMNCPYCGAPIDYVDSDEIGHVYACLLDGPLRLLGGDLRPDAQAPRRRVADTSGPLDRDR